MIWFKIGRAMRKPEQTVKKERRKYYRLRPTMPEKIEARVFFLDGQSCQAEVVNFSPAGILCFCTRFEEKFHVGDVFPQIEIRIPHKPEVTYAGKLVRKEGTGDPHAFYFAIKFEKFGGLQGIRIPSKKNRAPLETEVNAIFLTRLRQSDNFMQAENFHEEKRLRNRLYRSFQDVTAALRVEEKWFFLEILDELKRQEPNYSPGLLQEFLRLCRGAERASTERNAVTLTSRLNQLFRPVHK